MSTEDNLSKPLVDLVIKDEIKHEEDVRQAQEEQEEEVMIQAEDKTDDEQGIQVNNHHR